MFAAKRFNLDTFVHSPHSVVLTREGFQVEWPKEEEKIPHIVLNPNKRKIVKCFQVKSKQSVIISSTLKTKSNNLEKKSQYLSLKHLQLFE